ncbi:short-chain dehydrogenase [Fictibacillus phosphorivorans]|uniref:Short-chain dehydrogenase n=1 Tax=Fictibacillus phosphorivorans TaxID=1221500 RepID=A0A163RMS3_9BACL|nr:SDR family oxidoreductase [Fictibacillus phosphorivorans]KZE67180.1 short-chain dehydrogenase [Fictibacillus phosphorivorans]
MINNQSALKTALITGASSGIGLEFANLLAKDGYHVVLTARNEKRLNEIANGLRAKHGIEVTIFSKDLSLADAAEELTAEILAKGIEIDILINNAGFAAYGPFDETSWKDEKDMLQVNITALTTLTKQLLPGMIKRNRGKILNVASTAAFQPGPLMAVYYATKAYVLSFSEAIDYELRHTNVSVTALCPGATATNFEKRASLESSRLFQSGTMNAQDVALSGYNALMKEKAVEVPGFKNKALANIVRFLPRKTVLKVVHYVQDKK